MAKELLDINPKFIEVLPLWVRRSFYSLDRQEYIEIYRSDMKDEYVRLVDTSEKLKAFDTTKAVDEFIHYLTDQLRLNQRGIQMLPLLLTAEAKRSFVSEIAYLSMAMKVYSKRDDLALLIRKHIPDQMKRKLKRVQTLFESHHTNK